MTIDKWKQDLDLVEVSYYEMTEIFRKVEQEGERHVSGWILFTKESFNANYDFTSRLYATSSNNKAFRPKMLGYSIFGSSVDGTDPHVRLDLYMKDEKGGKDGWEVEKCFIERKEKR